MFIGALRSAHDDEEIEVVDMGKRLIEIGMGGGEGVIVVGDPGFDGAEGFEGRVEDGVDFHKINKCRECKVGEAR